MAGCKALSPDFAAVIAINVSVKDSVIEIGDTTRPSGFAVNGRGDSVPGATLVWTSPDSTIRVVDSTTGAAVGVSAGPGRLLARVGALRSNPAVVNVLGVLDSIVAVGDTVDTVAVPTDSGSLQVQAFSGGLASAQRKIALAVVFPVGGTGFTLAPGDTVVTGSNGIAPFFVRLTGARPDSAVVTASATYHGTPVAHSPIQFKVFFP